jgi:hypothetical protein
MPTASEHEKENGSEINEPLILITDKIRLIVRNGGGNDIPATGKTTEKEKNAHHHQILPM